MSKNSTYKRYEIHEMWIDKYNTLCQSVIYYSDDVYKPVINPNLTYLILRQYFDEDGNLVKEERYT